MSDRSAGLANHPFGFNWRPAKAKAWTRVNRMWSYRGQAVLRIDSGDPEAKSTIDVYISPAGRSIRVFRHGKELT